MHNYKGWGIAVQCKRSYFMTRVYSFFLGFSSASTVKRPAPNDASSSSPPATPRLVAKCSLQERQGAEQMQHGAA